MLGVFVAAARRLHAEIEKWLELNRRKGENAPEQEAELTGMMELMVAQFLDQPHRYPAEMSPGVKSFVERYRRPP